MRNNKLSWYEQSRLIALFVTVTSVRAAVILVGVNKITASYSGELQNILISWFRLSRLHLGIKFTFFQLI